MRENIIMLRGKSENPADTLLSSEGERVWCMRESLASTQTIHPSKKKKLGQLFSDSCRRVVQITSTILVKWEVRSLADGDK